MANEQQQIRVLCNGKETTGPAEISVLSSRDAALRGLKAFAMTALAALCTIMIPGVHFLSVPLGLLASPVIGILVFLKGRASIKGMLGDFLCPQCSAANHMDYQEGKPPYFGSCQSCKNPYQVFPLIESSRTD